IAPPEDLQLQSALAQLPTEIKHIIYGLCFVINVPIIDPSVSSNSGREKRENVSTLGVTLLQTCRRMYHEADLRPLFAQNTFRFTTVDTMQNFLHSLHISYRICIQDMEVDVREVHSDHPGIAREWLPTWIQTLGSLRADAVGLRCLRLNFTSWPSIAMFRTELWNLLRKMLSNLEGLERIVVVGASKGKGMGQKAPWSPVHFVGGDDV
ncbi:hypothetical protein EJ02DRAFT_300936, partial [Clathrospora elynae]